MYMYRDEKTIYDYPELYEDNYTGFDATQRWEAGVVSVDEMFDPYCQDVSADALPEGRFPFMTDADRAFDQKMRSLCPAAGYLDKDEEALLTRQAQDGSQEAKERLLETNLKFVLWFARETMGWHKKRNQEVGREATDSSVTNGKLQDYAAAPLDYSDRVQAVAMGLLQAIEKHDPERGRLKTIASIYMERALVREIQDTSEEFITRIPVHRHGEYRRIMGSTRQAADEGRRPNLDETVYETGLSHEFVEWISGRMVTLRSGLSVQYLTEYFDDQAEDGHDSDGPLSFADRVQAQEGLSAEAVSGQIATQRVVEEVLNDLSERERSVVEMRFGIADNSPMPLHEVAQALAEITGKQITRERVRQIEAKTLAKLRHPNKSGPLRGVLDGGAHEPGSGNRDGVIYVTQDELAGLNLPPVVRFDNRPSYKYRDTDRPRRSRFKYTEDW